MNRREASSAVQSDRRFLRGLYAVLEFQVFLDARLDDEVPLDAAGVLVQLSAPKGLGLDGHILVIGQRELVVDDNADGLGLAVVDGDFPLALKLALAGDGVRFVVVPSSLRRTWNAASGPSDRLSVSDARFRARVLSPTKSSSK